MLQLILHLIGDYWTQTPYMACNKTSSWKAAWFHASVYTVPFWAVYGWRAALVIGITHGIIDRFSLVKYLLAFKNTASALASMLSCTDRDLYPSLSKEAEAAADLVVDCFSSKSGYPSDTPEYRAFVLYVVADNTAHLLINWAAIRWLAS